MKGKMNKSLSLFGSPPPPKEGRYHSHQYLEKRKNFMFKLLAGALALALTYILYVSTTDPQTGSRQTERTKTMLGAEDAADTIKPQQFVPPVNAKLESTVDTKLAEHVDAEEEQIIVQKPKQTTTYQKPKLEADSGSAPAGKAKYGSNPSKEAPAPPSREIPEAPPAKIQKFTSANSGFKHALNRVFELLPDEMHVRELLRPIDGTGKEKLRETGLRARAFKTFFEAWEKLHLVVGENEAYVRDDIIQELRRDPTVENIAQTIHQYESYRGFLQRLGSLLFPYISPYFADHMSLHSQMYKGGRGIVLSAGDKQAPFLLTSIPSFRKLGCKLPIEIMYLGESDLSEDYRAELEQFDGVVTRDISAMVSDEGWKLAGWAAKPFAMLLSSFREVIFIDADSLFFKNPEVLFEDESYKKTGALFFRDRIIMPENKKRWLQQIIPKPISKKVRQSRFWTGVSGHMQESGVVVVDKWRHFVAMLLVTRMNGPDRDGNESKGIVGVYDMVYGDKETFWLGWELVADTDYAFHNGDAGIMGQLKEQEPKPTDAPAGDQAKTDDEPKKEKFEICAPQLLHLDLDGKPLWFNGWILDNKFEEGRKKRRANNFVNYLRENPSPEPDSGPDQWQLKESNICCLTTDQSYSFTKGETDALQMIMQLAYDAGAYGKKKK
ncbi:hypothetical protein H072_2571 [Dactylellina haptotyla CBS 200.50]|uniref:Alpha-1,3-mannosyltransferase n=1 Tax=Dactylellina haptotyla (strain CBS 200.50) TaxID=1284197 RepID=S8BVG1_DACHA|nr:hypothetical protein H072_2571 [Dactylellina haptotyla CBS 200.50]